MRGLIQLGGKWVSKRLLGDHRRLSPIFASRCFGVCLQRSGCPRRAARLVAVGPQCHPGSVSDPHAGCVEAATEQGQARLQGRPSSLAGSPLPINTLIGNKQEPLDHLHVAETLSVGLCCVFWTVCVGLQGVLTEGQTRKSPEIQRWFPGSGHC